MIQTEENSEAYQGWKNRETWATSLWLSNDEELYRTVEEMATQAKLGNQETPGLEIRELAEEIESFLENDLKGLVGPDSELVLMFEDIGSLWRVDWYEIAENWLAE